MRNIKINVFNVNTSINNFNKLKLFIKYYLYFFYICMMKLNGEQTVHLSSMLRFVS